MEQLAEELPYAAIVLRGSVETNCATCIAPLSSQSFSCDACSEVRYCSLRCQRRDWSCVHKFECEVLRVCIQGNKRPTPAMRLAFRILLQKYGPNSKCTSAFNGSSLDDLETNYDLIRSNELYNHFLLSFLTIIRSCALPILSQLDEQYMTTLAQVSQEEIFPIICAVLANAFSIIDEKTGESVGLGLYIGLSKHNHACWSDAHVVFDGNRAILRAPKGTSYSTQISISYTSRMLPTHERRRNIHDVHFFVCECELCKDVYKDARAMSCRCVDPQCDGYCNLSAERILSVAESSCSKCKSVPICNFDQMLHLIRTLLAELEAHEKRGLFVGQNALDAFQVLVQMIDKNKPILSNCNIALLLLKEQLAGVAYRLSESQAETVDLLSIGLDGCDEYIQRLGLEFPETARRLYTACLCAVASKKAGQARATFDKALQSCRFVYGETHPVYIDLHSLYTTIFLQ